MNARRGLLAVTLLAAVAVPSPGQTGNSRVFGDLLKRIPEQSNALMLVNVDGLFDSPMGRRENWRQKALANRGGGLGLAADVSKAAVAVGMDFHSMQERWKVGLVQLRRDVPVKLDDLAAREGGYVETVENTPVAWTPRDLYLFDFPDNLVGFASPTDRKGLVDWFRSALWHPRNFPPGFADRAIFRADAGAQIVLAFDLADAVSAQDGRALAQHVRRDQEDLHRPHAPRAAAGERQVGVPGRQGRPGDRGEPADRLRPRGRLHDPGGPDADPRPPGGLRGRAARDEDLALGFDKKTAVEMSGRLSEESVRKVLSMAHVPRLSADRPATAAGPRRREGRDEGGEPAGGPRTPGPSPTTSAPRRRTSGRSPR